MTRSSIVSKLTGSSADSCLSLVAVGSLLLRHVKRTSSSVTPWTISQVGGIGLKLGLLLDSVSVLVTAGKWGSLRVREHGGRERVHERVRKR